MKFNKDLLYSCLSIMESVCVAGAILMLEKNTNDLHKRLKRIENKNLDAK